MQSAFVFHRTELAGQFRDALLGRSPFSHDSGLFLAGPRRTGKSTFLRQDLTPLLDEAGVLTIYVDLWADRGSDPGKLIADALRVALGAHGNVVKRMIDRTGLNRISIAGIQVDLATVGEPGGVTIADALSHLHEASGKPIALIIDEAQHALSSDRGVDAMFALKAARDALNQGRETRVPNLMLIFTGSHRDKLVGLLRNAKQPFYGASVTDMPLLGDDYVTEYVGWLNQWLAASNQIDTQAAIRAFAIVGHRPELLEQVLRETATGPGGAAMLADTIVSGAEDLRARLWDSYDSDFGELGDVQRAVLAEIILQGASFQPYTAATLDAVSTRMGESTGKTSVQNAINDLKGKGLVWQSGRGQYAIEDQGMIEWLAARGVTP